MNRPAEHALDKVDRTWDGRAPDWVRMLAEQVDASSQRLAGRAIGYSAAVVSTVLANRYRGDLGRVEAAVRGAFMDGAVECPVLGPIRSDRCIKAQRSPLNTSSPQAAQLYRACRGGCPHSTVKGGQ